MLFVTILNALDIIAGLVLIFNFGFLVYPFGLIYLLKGAWTLYTSFKAGFFLEFLGAVDFLCGAVLLLMHYNFSSSYFIIIGIIIIIKGAFLFMLR